MILGIGSDLVDIRRIQASLDRFGERFTARVFTGAERAAGDGKPTPAARAAFYAKRFAAKEAASKALGTGYADGVYFCDLEVVSAANGRPALQCHGGALARLQALTPPGMAARIDLSMTDEPPYAQAFIVISTAVLP
ncbi:holo-ACP synthase [Niveispirillum sp. SYP-B3756]|uniref:holo-ACP synthase n=1 Tax=Niveispirillum sp. SYP-B3756 TaxID=2662178 RepID=UPI0012910DCB|nr:holo-ACP synthase [Niveispirillum sp. SYP-B3756]MQP63800.1 holo-ACP synthase [Niveispirillum sp. SYP-B3756]